MAGAPSWLNYESMFDLMFLKRYTKINDEKLVERLNSDACFKLFCGIKTDLFLQPIKDKTLVTRVRKYLSIHLDVNKLQKNMIDFGKPEMKDCYDFT